MSKEIRKGSWVLATKKSLASDNYKEFLKDYPLGVAQINSIEKSGIVWIKVKTPDRINQLQFGYYGFDPSDLVPIKK